MTGKVGGLLGREPGGQHPHDGAADIQRQCHHERRGIGHRAFLASPRGDFREVRGTGNSARGGAQFIRIAAQQHGAAARRNDVSDEPDKLAFERGPMAAAPRHADGAKQKQQRAGAQQRVLRRIRRQLRQLLVIDQHGFADADLVAGLEPVLADAHSIDEGPRAGASIDNPVAALALAHDAVLPGRLRFAKLDVRGGRSADAGFARPQRKPLSEKRSADDDQLRLHGPIRPQFSRPGSELVNLSVHRREPSRSHMAEIGVAGTCFQRLTNADAVARQLPSMCAYRGRRSEPEGG